MLSVFGWAGVHKRMIGFTIRAILLLQDILITARKRSLGQGNVFTPVCHSVDRRGVADTPPPPRRQLKHPTGIYSCIRLSSLN